jgi:16S rRNA (cytosine1402-N4)-methyltransferase
MQLDNKEKGFSFLKEGPLDMRMDRTGVLTAEHIINRWPEKKLGELFKAFGEEPRWRLAAKAIVERRKKALFKTTTDLSSFLAATLKRTRKKLHPATLIFQALRICVNDELNSVTEGLNKAIKHLAPGGRLGVISFHRLEDRIVKNLFKEAARPGRGYLILTKKPLEPTDSEVRENPRSRSAKMRFLEREDE